MNRGLSGHRRTRPRRLPGLAILTVVATGGALVTFVSQASFASTTSKSPAAPKSAAKSAPAARPGADPLPNPCTQPQATPSNVVPPNVPGHGFEIDGNLCVNTAGNLDWANVGGQPVANDGFGDSTQFTSGASENSWPWAANQTNATGTAGSSQDIGSVYAFTQVVATEVFAYFGFQRAASSGTVAYWLELNQHPNVFGPMPARANGDLRLNFVQAGNAPITLQAAQTWTGSAWGQTLCGSAPACAAAGFLGATNSVTGVTDLSGTPLAPFTFAEAAVDLSTLFPAADCSGTFGVMNLRSSASNNPNSSLGDYINPVNVSVPSTCASIQVNKEWAINGTVYPNGSQPPGFTPGQLSLTPPPLLPSGQTSPQFGQTFDRQQGGAPYEPGTSITIGEATPSVPPNCTIGLSQGTGDHSLTAGLNTFLVTNVVTCPTLTLQKDWVDGVVGDTAELSILGPEGSRGSAKAMVPPSGNGLSPEMVTAPVFAGERVEVEESLPGTNTGAYTSQTACTPGAGFTPGTGGQGGGILVPPTPSQNIVCTITNTRSATGQLTLEKTWVNGAYPSDRALLEATGGGLSGASGTATAIVPEGGTGLSADRVEIPITTGNQVRLSETLSSTNTGTYTTTLACTPSSGLANGTFTVTSDHENVVCVVINVRTFALLTLHKDWVNGATGDQALLSITGQGPAISNQPTSTATAIAPGGTAPSTQTATADIFSGQDITVSEILPPTNRGFYTSSLSCDNGTTVNPGTSGTFTVPRTPPATVSCTFTNSRVQSQVILQKGWENGALGDSTVLSITGPSGVPVSENATVPPTGSGLSAQMVTATVSSGDSIEVHETPPGPTGTYTSTLVCTPPTLDVSTGLSGQGGTFDVPSTIQSITCTFTNVRVASTVTLTKTWVNPVSGDVANLFITGPGGSLAAAPATAPADTTIGPVTVLSGDTIVLGETLPTTNTGAYTSALVCNPDTGFTAGSGGLDGQIVVPATPTSFACTITNTRAPTGRLILQKSWTNGAAGDSTTLTATGSGVVPPDGSGSTLATVPGTGTTSINMVNIAVASGETVQLSEAMTAGNHGTYTTTLTCNEGTLADGTLTVPNPPHGNITCTFTNVRVASTVTLTKTWVNPVSGDVANLFITGPGGSLAAAPATAPADTTIGPVTVLSGDTIVLGETLPTTNTGAYTSALVCNPDTGFTAGSGGLDGQIVVPATPTSFACTITNTRSATAELTLLKSWANGAAGDSTTLTATGSGVLPDGSGSTEALVPPPPFRNSIDMVNIAVASGETVQLSEAMTAGNHGAYATTLVCNTAGLNASTDTFTVPAGGPGNIACAFINTRVASTVALTKTWVNPVTGDVANLFIAGPGGSLASDTAAAPADTTIGPVTVLSGDTITLGETMPPTNNGAYTSAVVCNPGTGFTPGTGGVNGQIVVPPTPTNFACTMTNTRAPTGRLILQKDWVHGAAGDSTTLTATGSGVVPDGSGSTLATVPGTGTSSINVVNIAVASSETVQLTEAITPTNHGTYTTTLACNAGTLNAATGQLTVPAPSNGTITCTFTNERVASTVVLHKTWVNPVDGDDAHLFIAGPGGSLATDVATAPLDSALGPVTMLSGDTFTLGETLAPTNTGAYTSALVCNPDTGFTAGTGGLDGQIVVPSTSTNFACTITNTRAPTGRLILQKDWTNGAAGDSTTLTATGTGVVPPDGSGSTLATVPGTGTTSINMVNIAVASGETVDLSEIMGENTGTYATTLACNAGSLNAAIGQLTVPNPPHGNITCTFTNVRVQSTVTLLKTWVNSVANDQAVMSILDPGGLLGEATAIAPGGTGPSPEAVGPLTVLSGDTITVGETLPTTNIGAYSPSITCEPPTGFSPGAGGQSGTIVVPTTPEDVTCTLTNTRAATGVLTLEKTWTDGAANDSTTLSAQGTSGIPSGSGTAVAHVPEGGNGPSPDTVVIDIASGEAVHLSEMLGENTGTYTTTLTCNEGSVANDTLTVPNPPHGNITCTFTNVREPVPPPQPVPPLTSTPPPAPVPPITDITVPVTG
jgi:hypothetical protein